MYNIQISNCDAMSLDGMRVAQEFGAGKKADGFLLITFDEENGERKGYEAMVGISGADLAVCMMTLPHLRACALLAVSSLLKTHQKLDAPTDRALTLLINTAIREDTKEDVAQ